MINLLKFLQQNLNIKQKKIIVTIFDILLLIIAIIASFIIKYESFDIYLSDNIYVFILGILIFVINSLIFNLNQQIIRTFNISNVIFLSKFVIVLTFIFVPFKSIAKALVKPNTPLFAAT